MSVKSTDKTQKAFTWSTNETKKNPQNELKDRDFRNYRYFFLGACLWR